MEKSAIPPKQNEMGDLVDQLMFDWQRERPDLDCRSMAVIGRLIHLGALLRLRASEALADHDVSYTDLDILATLRRIGAPFCLTPTELMDRVLLTSGAMTAALNRLEKRSLIDRGIDSRDRRVKTVSLTGKGRQLVDSAIHTRFAEADAALSPLSTSEAKQLAALLRKLAYREG